MGETKGQDLSSSTQRRALFTLGEGLEAAFSGSTTLLRAPYGVTNFYNRRATWTRKIVRSVKPGPSKPGALSNSVRNASIQVSLSRIRSY